MIIYLYSNIVKENNLSLKVFRNVTGNVGYENAKVVDSIKNICICRLSGHITFSNREIT